MMDYRNTLFSHQTFARAIEFIWREAELLDRRDYRAWLDLWAPSGFLCRADRPERDRLRGHAELRVRRSRHARARAAHDIGLFGVGVGCGAHSADRVALHAVE